MLKTQKARPDVRKHANANTTFYVTRGCWVANWFEAGRRRTVRLPGATDVVSARIQYQQRHRSLVPENPEPYEPRVRTLRSVFAVFERQVMRGYRASTVSIYRQVIDLLEKARIVTVEDVRPDKLRTLTDVLIDEEMQPPTQHKILRHAKRFFRWARDVGYVADVPKFTMPRVRKKSKGRPLTEAEFHRMLSEIKNVYHLKPERAAAVERLMWGLWWGGLRVGEIGVSWDDENDFHVDWKNHKRPVFVMPDQLDKTAQARVFPMAPEFWKLIATTPEHERHGPVFTVLGTWRRCLLTAPQVSILIRRIGKRAGVVVNTSDGKVKYASAHDLRRSFILRWASKVNQMQCGAICRHMDPKTTSIYYIGTNAANLLDGFWE